MRPEFLQPRYITVVRRMGVGIAALAFGYVVGALGMVAVGVMALKLGRK